MKTRIYCVLFDTERRAERRTMHYVFHCEASNAKEATAICKADWRAVFKDNPKTPHQFHLHATRSSLEDPALLRVVTWRSAVINGSDCLDNVFCTGWTNWRR